MTGTTDGGGAPRRSRKGRAASSREPDPRAVALADYLRRRSGAFSLSADVTESASTAQAGMALLDAAMVAEQLGPDDPIMIQLSEAGMFESMPVDRARFVETAAVRQAIQRPLAGTNMDASEILRAIAAEAKRW